MKKDFKDRLAACIKDLTGAEIKGITIDEESSAVSVVLVPGRGHGRVSLSQLPEVLKVADVDIVGGASAISWNHGTWKPTIPASAASSPSSVGKPAARSTTWSSAPANCSTN